MKGCEGPGWGLSFSLAPSCLELPQATSNSHHLVLESPSWPGAHTVTLSSLDACTSSPDPGHLGRAPPYPGQKGAPSHLINSHAQTAVLFIEHSEHVRWAGPTNFSLQRQGWPLMCPAPGDLLGGWGGQLWGLRSADSLAPLMAPARATLLGHRVGRRLNYPTVHSILRFSEKRPWTDGGQMPSSLARVSGHYPFPAC